MKTLSAGMSGPEVKGLQYALNVRPPTSLAKLAVDGAFGAKTDARVREFQQMRGLGVDGIVGPKTAAALSKAASERAKRPFCCGNVEPIAKGLVTQIAANFRHHNPDGGAASGVKGTAVASTQPKFGFAAASTRSAKFAGASRTTSKAVGDNPFRMLTDPQRAVAKTAYGNSLDFSAIFISNKTGLGDRPFTVAIPDGPNVIQIINCGSFTPSDRLLIHELAHVWQSQHHSDPYAFMSNAVASQAGAVKDNLAEVANDPFVITEDDYPMFYPFDAYAYHPSAAFSTLAAEQMASAIEHGVPTVRAHVQGLGLNAIDSALVQALSRPGWADRRLPGIRA